MWMRMTSSWLLADLWHIPLSFGPLHSRSLKQVSKDCWHLVEALGSARWPISHCIFNRVCVKLQASDFPLPVWNFFSGFCLPCEFCYTHRHHSSSFRNFRVFLSKYTNNMHILATGTEEQAVYSGHLWHLIHPNYSILPPAIRSY